MALLMPTAALPPQSLNQTNIKTSNITSSSQASSSSSSNPINITIKSKKRARFADENYDETTAATTTTTTTTTTTSNNNEKQKQHCLSSYITFNHDDPPLKKIRIQAEPSSFDLFDQPANDTLRKGMYLTFINTAFTERANGKFERYDQLLGQFDPLVSPQTALDSNQSNVSLTRVQGWLSALTSMVSQLDRGHSHLVEKVLSLPWTVLDDQFVNVFSRFVSGLVSARSEWVQIVLENIIRGFHYSTIPLEQRSALLPSSVNRRLIYLRLHSLLRSILRLIPTLPSTLWSLLDLHFPKKREHRDGHVCYLSNLLKIANYCPDLSAKIVQLCIEKCLKIDVDIQVEVEEWEDEEGRLDEEIFGKPIEDAFDKSWTDDDAHESDLDDEDDDGEEVDFDELSSDEGDLSDDENEKNLKTPSPESVRKVKKLAAKLDGMLRCIFDHLQLMSLGVALKPTTLTTNPTETNEHPGESKEQISLAAVDPQHQDDREAMFNLLLSNFESSILRTRRTRHVQFIMFWYASLEPAFADSLLATLVERGLYDTDDNSLPVATRVAAVSYIASLISRAKYIDKHVTRHVVSLLCARLELGLAEAHQMNVNQHVVWYAIAQAIFYIFCFRWKDLLVEDDDDDEQDEANELNIRFSHPKKFNDRWLSGLKILERAIISPLNPLRTCADTVVSQFAKISHETNFIYCYDIMRRNNNNQQGKETEKKGGTQSKGLSVPSSTSSTCSPSYSPSSGTSSLPMVDGRPEQPLRTSSHEQVVNKALFQSKIDLFFPFDPFKLPLSSAYIQTIYRSWDHGDDDEDDDEDDAEEENTDGEDEDANGNPEE
ncbi:hypothetical protein PGT21_021731 [Puccinia graminis f. sp. tritici]|uniref:RNA polymerase I-specific transcription initiation factor rrn3 n=1 Tax=Puccinia graminis f. sp. tritici TaxID=56615 RepID=A0A5B0NWD7_PUCGR|nr:hypothetical protein PGT21_021731 [Puccinia graminis f. sp. tritici]KAA1092390.1 hypothetical protein PGTUg99_025481 [Puccinia graminis f. sp. tritici]